MIAAPHSAAVIPAPRRFGGYRGLRALFPAGAGVLLGEQRNSAFGTREQATAAKTYRVNAYHPAGIDAVNQGGRGGGVARRLT